MPLERVEAQICELAGHLAAATCRFLVLLGDFDARRGWASWEMGSCAQWLSWKRQLSSGTAREHVRVARALRDLPVIRARFAAGRLSYAKVRALTRIATPATEAGLAGLAGPMTANQLERFARAHRQVTRADDAGARVRRRLTWRVEEDGSLSGAFRLPPLQGAVLLTALRAACADLAGDPRTDVSAETPVCRGNARRGHAARWPAGRRRAGVRTSSDLADGLVAVAESFLAGKVAGADDAEIYQVVVHAGTDVLAGPAAPGTAPGVSAETPAAPARVPGTRRPGPVPRRGRPGDQRVHRADARLHRGAVVDDATATPARSWPSAGDGAAPARRSAGRPGNGTAAGAGSRAASPAGRTCTTSSTGSTAAAPTWTTWSACARITTRWCTTAATSSPPRPAAEFTFYRPDGTPLPACPPLPEPDGGIGPPTTPRSPRTRSSRPGTASAST